MMISIVGRCPFCGDITEIEVEEKQLAAWENGELIQNAFPTLSASHRELLMSGICFDCQDTVFGDDE